jgi:hypothetical protein
MPGAVCYFGAVGSIPNLFHQQARTANCIEKAGVAEVDCRLRDVTLALYRVAA